MRPDTHTALVTGGAGFIGSALVRALPLERSRPVVQDRGRLDHRVDQRTAHPLAAPRVLDGHAAHAGARRTEGGLPGDTVGNMVAVETAE